MFSLKQVKHKKYHSFSRLPDRIDVEVIGAKYTKDKSKEKLRSITKHLRLETSSTQSKIFLMHGSLTGIAVLL